VTSIIALLIGILLPALGAARNTAKLAACLSNVRQMAIATNAYLVDNRDVTPAATTKNTPGSGALWKSSGTLLAPYLSGNPRQIYRCPSAEGTPDDQFDVADEDPFDPNKVFSPNY